MGIGEEHSKPGLRTACGDLGGCQDWKKNILFIEHLQCTKLCHRLPVFYLADAHNDLRVSNCFQHMFTEVQMEAEGTQFVQIHTVNQGQMGDHSLVFLLLLQVA